MSKRLVQLLLLSLAMLVWAHVASAQFLTFYGHIYTANGAPVPNITVSATPVLCPSGSPVSFRKGGGGQVTLQAVTTNVDASGYYTMPLPDVDQSSPQHIGFRITAVNNDDPSGQPVNLLGGGGYNCVQPSMTGTYASSWCGTVYSGCDFDLYPPNLPTVPTVQLNGTMNVTYASGLYVDVRQYPGATLGAQIQAADSALAGQAAVFAILQPSTTGTAFTLSAAHSLAVYAPVQWSAPAVATTDNSVRCYGAGSIITNTMSSGDASQDSLFVEQGYQQATNFTFEDCHVEQPGLTSNADIMWTNLGSVDATFRDNYIHNGQIYMQQGGGVGYEGKRLTVTGNTDYCDGAGAENADVLVYTYMTDFHVDHNHFEGCATGAELFYQDAASYPSPATIQASGLHDGTFSNNVCLNMGDTCGWGSEMFRVSFLGNVVNGAGDVALDAEGSSEVLFGNNQCYGGSAGCITFFYTGFQNVVRGNKLYGNAPISIRNNSANELNQRNLLIADNDFDCGGVAAACAIGYFEPNSGTVFQGNQFVNMGFTPGALVGGYSNMAIVGNHFAWTNPNPFGFDIFGAAAGNGSIDTPQITLIKDNVIDGDFQQGSGSYCIEATSTDYNFQDTYLFTGNVCQGGWSADALVTNGSGNTTGGANPTGISGNFVFRMNNFMDDTSANGTITGGTTSGQLPPNVIHSGNYGQFGTSTF